MRTAATQKAYPARIVFGVMLAIVALLGASRLGATTYYVATAGGGGSDSNDGSSGSPWLTIQHAADTMVAGDTVIVRDGTYAKFTVSTSGTAGSPITYQAENPGGATVDGAAGGQEPVFVSSTVGWIVIDGFEITNHDNGGISLQNTVHDVVIRRNVIHQIGFICTDTTGGIVGIRDKDDTTNVLVERNLFYDIKRLHPGESGCSPATNNWQNHDHGYYLRAQNATVINNVFRAHTGGWAIQLSPGANGFLIAHNTFIGANPNRDGHIVVWGLHDSFEISNNISFGATNSFLSVTADGGDPCGEKTNAVVRNNWISEAAIDDQGGCSWTTVSGNQLSAADPQFVDDANDDYHLTASSPVIGFGVTDLGITTDADGNTRDASPDAGAYEYIAQILISGGRFTAGIVSAGRIGTIVAGVALFSVTTPSTICTETWAEVGDTGVGLADEPLEQAAADLTMGDACDTYGLGETWKVRPTP